MKSQSLFFDVLGKTSIHVGVAALASSAKLSIIVGLNLQGLAETILFAENNGVSRRHAQYYQRRSLWQWVTKIKSTSIQRTPTLPLLRSNISLKTWDWLKKGLIRTFI
jgi:3-hydroxyisobutyrate dehydrogenase-like beta-hydroxyacid dehydrogenase